LRLLTAALLVAGTAAVGQAAEPPPRLVRFHAADYPESALARVTEGEVLLRVAVTAEGRVAAVYAEREVDAGWVAPAQSALLRCSYEAASAPSTFLFTYRFALQRPHSDPVVRFVRAGAVRGEVLAGGTRLALAGADVVVQGLGLAATTDAKGRFSIDLPAGSHVLVVAARGFAPLQERVELEPGKDAEVTLLPRRVAVDDLQATVQGERGRAAPSRSTMVREEMRNVPGSLNDPLRVVENLPGLARAPYSGGQLIVRGARPNDTGAYIDGQRIPILYHLLNGPSVLGEEMVERIDFLAGGADAFYGRNLAGIVSAQSRRGDPDRLHGSLTVDLNKSAAFLQGPLGARSQFAVGARRSYVNPVLAAMADPKHELTLPVYWDYQARVDHQLATGDRIGVLLYGSDDSTTVVGGGEGSVPRLDGLRIGFHRLKLTWERRLSESSSLMVSPLLGFDLADHRQQGGSGAFAAPQREEERTLAWGARAEVRWKPRPWLDMRAGLDALFDRAAYKLDRLYSTQLRSVGAPNAEQAVREGVHHLASVAEYVEAEVRAGPLRLTPGLRLEQMHWARHTYLLTEPRVWARLSLDAATALYAYAGLYHSAPTPQQLDELVGNPDLIPQRAEQYGLGITRQLGGLWSIRVEGYLNRRGALVFPAPPRARADGAYDNQLQRNSGTGRSAGLEVLIRRELTGRLYGWLAYTLSRSREIARPGLPWTPTTFDQPHVLTLLVGWRPSPQVEFSTRLRLATGNPLAPVEGASFDADSGSYVPARLGFGQERLPTFLQLDFEINNIWSADLYQLSLYIDFQNILNRPNAENLLYDYRFARNAAIHGLPFLASVGARVSF